MTEKAKYLVISDSHGYRGKLEHILMASDQEGPFQGVLHLGDGFLDPDRFADRLPPVIRVPGNCDGLFVSPDVPAVRVETLGGAKVLLTHGHTLHVRSGRDALLQRALQEGARAALFGHTHEPLMETRQGILLLNPGAAMNGKYAVLTVYANGAVDAQLMSL